MNQPDAASETPKSSRWPAPLAAAAGLGIALTASNAFLLITTARIEEDLKLVRASIRSEVRLAQAESIARERQLGKTMDALRQQIAETGARSFRAVGAAQERAATDARAYSDRWAARLAEEQRAQMQRHRLLSSQLGEMRESGTETASRVGSMATDITTVRHDLSQTRGELDRTLQELRTMRGDLGVQSGLIATNARELNALRALGERYYFEFNLAKSKDPQRIGDVAVQLRKSDLKRNRYTIDLITNDRKVQKKDRTVNEPVQFYMGTTRTPYELVVNEVRNDRIIGYLAAPKSRDVRQ
jgi:hypothetical protein